MEHYKNYSLELLTGYDLEGNLVTEEFRDIPDYEGLYQISTFGRVKKLPTIMNGGINKGYGMYKERILAIQLNRRYILTSLNKNGRSKHFLVHRIVSQVFIPNQNNYPQVNHKDLNKLNNCVWNLEWMTVRQNQEHYQASIITKSKYVGVSYISSEYPLRKKRWIASVSINSIKYHLGYFLTELEAYEARQKKIKELESL